jgi:hypothetical protein
MRFLNLLNVSYRVFIKSFSPQSQKSNIKMRTIFRVKTLGFNGSSYVTDSLPCKFSYFNIRLTLFAALKPKMKSHYRGHKMAVWLNLIPQLHQPGDEDVSMRHHHFHERAEHYYSGKLL